MKINEKSRAAVSEHFLTRTSASESAELGVRFDKAFQDPPVLSRADPVTTLPSLSRQPPYPTTSLKPGERVCHWFIDRHLQILSGVKTMPGNTSRPASYEMVLTFAFGQVPVPLRGHGAARARHVARAARLWTPERDPAPVHARPTCRPRMLGLLGATTRVKPGVAHGL